MAVAAGGVFGGCRSSFAADWGRRSASRLLSSPLATAPSHLPQVDPSNLRAESRSGRLSFAESTTSDDPWPSPESPARRPGRRDEGKPTRLRTWPSGRAVNLFRFGSLPAGRRPSPSRAPDRCGPEAPNQAPPLAETCQGGCPGETHAVKGSSGRRRGADRRTPRYSGCASLLEACRARPREAPRTPWAHCLISRLIVRGFLRILVTEEPDATTVAAPSERGGIVRIAQVAPFYEPVPPARYGGTERVVAYLNEGASRP